jgi:hypothetical protein
VHQNQIIELWRSLSACLTRVTLDEQLPRDECTDDEKSDRDGEYAKVDPIETHPAKGGA